MLKARLMSYNPESQRAWYLKNREKQRAYRKEWYAKNKEKVRESNRLRRYGVTAEVLQEMLTNQDNRCAICTDVFDSNPRFTHVDHCHKTGRVRGLLCNRCNALIGYAKEDAAVLKAAVEYLAAERSV